MKRFYKLVSTHNTALGYEIQLDGRVIKTQTKQPLLAPTESLANEIMKEWMDQGEVIIPDTMPVTALLNTKIDRVSHERDVITAALMKYLNTDLICYRADQTPAMKQAQESMWDPALDWFEKTYGERLETTTTLAALTHSSTVHEAVHNTIQAMDDDRFTVLQSVVMDSGSLILGLMFMTGDMNAASIYACARVEAELHGKIYLEDQYGKDPHQEKKDAALLRDLTAAEVYLQCL